MIKKDLVIIGHGIGGSVLAQKALGRGLSVLVIDQNFELGSSWIAGGLLHPMVFKRLTLAWPGLEESMACLEYYQNLESAAWHPGPLVRRISTLDEAHRWEKSTMDPHLTTLLTILDEKVPKGISTSFGWGRVELGGWLDVPLFLTQNWQALEAKGLTLSYHLAAENLDSYSPILTIPKYEAIEYKHLVLATGISAPGWKVVPSLGEIPFYGVKGEILDLWLPELELETIVLGPLFLVPLEEQGMVRVGSTYEREYTDSQPSVTEAHKMLSQLGTFLPFLANWSKEELFARVRGHRAGIRPAARDRRPYLGPLGDNKAGAPPGTLVMNGLGARGCMVAPYAAELLLDFIQWGIPIPPELRCTPRRCSTVTSD
ncbi:MAG: FAD-dependent oxidoreductase [Spirochaetales bacterium]|nr:FAD-dependent oxidoreductase [Spirochaetales bacterium]